MKILLTGASGQVGWELRRSLAPLGQIVAPDSKTLDLSSADAMVRVVREVKPDLIVNPGAYTAVDRAESEADLAMAINGRAPGILAEEAKRLGASLIHYSTDYVFDGSKAGAYVETDTTNPLNVYGRSKLAGEQAIQAVDGAHLILRTSWVYGARGRNFLLTMSKLMRERPELRVVNDQWGASTSSRFIADATAQLLNRLAVRESRELLNLAAGSHWSWYDFAVAIRENLAAGGEEKLANLVPIPAADYPSPVTRPTNSRLDVSRLKALGVFVPSSRELLDLVMAS